MARRPISIPAPIRRGRPTRSAKGRPMPRRRAGATAVFDAGRTNLKLVVIDARGDVRHEAAATQAIDAIVPTAHGSAFALLDATDLALPVMAYDAEPPREIVAAYGAIAPDFAEC